MTYFWAAMKDYKMWIGMLIYMGCDMPLYAFSLFLPTIITGMGFTALRLRAADLRGRSRSLHAPLLPGRSRG